MLDLNGQFWVGFLTIINTQLIKRIDGYYKLYNQYSSAKVIPIDNGCDYFSNFFCQYALIYKNDFSTEKFNANLLGKMIEINQSIKDKRLIWIIVPNKYSTYIESKIKYLALLFMSKG